MTGNRIDTRFGRVTVMPAWEALQGARAAVFEIPPSRLDGIFERRAADAMRGLMPEGMRFALVAVDPRVPLDARGCGLWTSEAGPRETLALLRVAVRDLERHIEEGKPWPSR